MVLGEALKFERERPRSVLSRWAFSIDGKVPASGQGVAGAGSIAAGGGILPGPFDAFFLPLNPDHAVEEPEFREHRQSQADKGGGQVKPKQSADEDQSPQTRYQYQHADHAVVMGRNGFGIVGQPNAFAHDASGSPTGKRLRTGKDSRVEPNPDDDQGGRDQKPPADPEAGPGRRGEQWHDGNASPNAPRVRVSFPGRIVHPHQRFGGSSQSIHNGWLRKRPSSTVTAHAVDELLTGLVGAHVPFAVV